MGFSRQTIGLQRQKGLGGDAQPAGCAQRLRKEHRNSRAHDVPAFFQRLLSYWTVGRGNWLLGRMGRKAVRALGAAASLPANRATLEASNSV